MLSVALAVGLPAIGVLEGSASGASVRAGETVYVASSDNHIWQYSVGAGGVLGSHGSTAVKGFGTPYSIAASPNGRYLYVSDDAGTAAGSVSQFTIGANGALTADRTPTVAVGSAPPGTAPDALTVSRDGKYVYVVGESAAVVYQFTIGSGGMLKLDVGHTIKTGLAPNAIATSPNGRYVYVADEFGAAGGEVSQYTVGAGGVLSADRTAAVGAGAQPDGITVSPNGKYVYVTNYAGSAGVSQYTVGRGGMLSPDRKPTVRAGGAPHGVAVSPNGKFLYVATERGAGTSSTSGAVSQYVIGSGGMLTPDRTPAVGAGSGPFGIVVSPDGRYVYVANGSSPGSDGVSRFTIGGGGMLTADPTPGVATGARPVAITVVAGNS